MNPLDLLLSFFNQYLFTEAKNNVSELEYFYQTNPATSTNPLVAELINAIKTYDLDAIGAPLFKSILLRANKSETESKQIMDEVIKWKNYSKEQIAPAQKYLRDICASSILQKAQRTYGNSASDFLKYLKTVNLKTSDIDTFSSVNLGEIDINSMVADSADNFIPSHYDWINKTYAPYNGYPKGQMVIVSAAPGCFSGETEIMLPDGTVETFENLYKDKEENISVYSYDVTTDQLKLSMAQKCIITKYVDSWIEVTIDEKKYKVTPEHEFLLTDGTYKRACDLCIGDSIMPLNRKLVNYVKDSSVATGGYEFIYAVHSGRGTTIPTHIAGRRYYEDRYPELFKNGPIQIHHNKLDENNKFVRSNNRLENLLPLSFSEHTRLHSLHKMADPELKKKFLEDGKSTRFTSEEISKRNRENWENDYERMREIAAKNFKKAAEVAKMDDKHCKYEGQKAKVLGVQKYIHRLIEDNIVKTKEDIPLVYDKYRSHKDEDGNVRYTIGPRTPSFKSAMKYYNDDLESMYEDGKTYNNHEVTNIRTITCDSPEPAYDLYDVWGYHNYAINYDGKSGFFVHNCGKSLFMMSEALHMALNKKKVLYVALGDLNMKDFVVRLGAMYSGMSFADTTMNLGAVFDSLKKLLTNGTLEVSINPAGKVGGQEMVDYVMSRADDFEVVMVDYDSNAKGAATGEDSMYNSFGNLYEKLNEIVLAGKLVFIGSQIKVTAWEKEIVDMVDVGESSRKQHTADCIIGIGRVVDCPNHVHAIKLSKNRRGEENVIAYAIRLSNARWKMIPRGVYDTLKQGRDKVEYTEAQIDRMIETYNAQFQRIQQDTQKIMNATQNNNMGGGASYKNTPFG